MRIRFVLTVLASFGLCSCKTVTAYLNADDLTSGSDQKQSAAPCNDLEQQGEEVELTASSDAAPVPQGGTIEDGTYVLTNSTLHTKAKPGGSKLVALGRITVVVNGSTSQMVRNATDGRERRTTINRVTEGTATTLLPTCVSPDPKSSEKTTTRYTATRDSFKYITPGPAGTVVATYTKL